MAYPKDLNLFLDGLRDAVVKDLGRSMLQADVSDKWDRYRIMGTVATAFLHTVEAFVVREWQESPLAMDAPSGSQLLEDMLVKGIVTQSVIASMLNDNTLMSELGRRGMVHGNFDGDVSIGPFDDDALGADILDTDDDSFYDRLYDQHDVAQVVGGSEEFLAVDVRIGDGPDDRVPL